MMNVIMSLIPTCFFFFNLTLVCFDLLHIWMHVVNLKFRGEKHLKKKCLTQANINTQTLNTAWQLSLLKKTSPSSSETCTFCGTTHRWADTSLSHQVHCASRDHLNVCIYAVNNLSINNGVEPGTAKTPVGVVCAPEIVADPVIPSQPPELRLCFLTVEVSFLMFCSIFIKKTWSAQSMLSLTYI